MRPENSSSRPDQPADNQTLSDASPVGDANIERLLSRVYQPETPTADFVARVEQTVAAAAAARREAFAEAPTPVSRLPGGEVLALRPWQILLGWAAAILVLVGTIALVNQPRETPERAFVRNGDVVWHQGTPFLALDADSQAKGKSEPPSASSIANLAKTSSSTARGGITARSAPPPAKATLAKLGETIATSAVQRRVALPDGSLLHLDRNTSVAIEGPRHVRLLSGQAFVEVQPANPPEQRFVVRTPHRELTALGTKFAVTVAEKGTDLLVTQGKVQAGDAPQPVAAGQRLAASQQQPAAAPRLSHSLDWARDLIASRAGPLVPPSRYAGGSLVAKGPAGQEATLSLRKYHVDVHIEDGFARTTIDQTYFNHETWRLEGTFYFPLPPDASLSRLAMYVGPHADGRRHGRARLWPASLRDDQVPQPRPGPAGMGGRQHVQDARLPAGAAQEKRIVLSYTQRLPTVYGRTHYRFPAGHSLEKVRDWSLRMLVKGGAALPWECASHTLVPKTIRGDNGAKDLVLTTEAHEVKIDTDVALTLDEPSTAGAGVGWVEERDPPNRRGEPATGGSRSSTHPTATADSPRFSRFDQDGWSYLMLRYRPALAPTLTRRASEGESPSSLPRSRIRQNSDFARARSLATSATTPRRDWLFLFESSADRDPLLARAQIEIIRGLLENAEHDDTFNIVTANTRATQFKAQPQPATPENIAAAVEFLESTRLIGALDLDKAFAAAKPHLAAAEHPVLVHLGSGIPVLGQRQADKLVADLPARAAYVGVGVGKRWNRALMRQAASRTGGYVTQINPDEPLAWRALELLSTLNAPRLLDLQVQAAGETAAAPAFLLLDDSLADGEEMWAVTRVPSDQRLPTKVRVTGRLVGRIGNPSDDVSHDVSRDALHEVSFQREFPTHPFTPGAGYLPRTWAKQEIDRLVAADAAKNREAIIALSKAMYVMSPFTSLLVLENEAMYAEYKVDRGRKDHWAMYPCPERIEVVREPLPAAPSQVVKKASEKTKPSVEEVLRTLLVRVPKPLLHRPKDKDTDYSGTYAASAWFGNYYFDIDDDIDRPFQVFGKDTVGAMSGGATRVVSRTLTGRYSVGVGINPDAGVLGNIVLEDSRINYRALHGVAQMLNERGFRSSNKDVTVGLSAPGVFSADLDIPVWRWHGNRAEPDFDALISLITRTIRPETWQEVGGPGSVESFEGNLSLVISQTAEVHHEIADFWAMNSFFRQTPASASGVHQSYGDASVRPVPFNVDPLVWLRLGHRADGRPVEVPNGMMIGEKAHPGQALCRAAG